MKSKNYEIKTDKGQFNMMYISSVGYLKIYGATYAPKIYEIREALKTLPTIAPDLEFSHPWRISKTQDKNGNVEYALFLLCDQNIGTECNLCSVFLDSDKNMSRLYSGPLGFLHMVLKDVGLDMFTNEHVVCWEMPDK